jgi:hypothetical protein
MAACAQPPLKNSHLRAGFDPAGTVTVTDVDWPGSLQIDSAGFAVTINGKEYRSETLTLSGSVKSATGVTDSYEVDGFTLRMVTELLPEWHFVSRQLFITTAKPDPFKINRIEMFRGVVKNPVLEAMQVTAGKYGLALRLRPEAEGAAAYGCFMLIQNPYSKYEAEGQRVKLAYDAEMNWNPADGEFPSDRFCLGTYRMTGHSWRQDMAGEWVYEPDPEGFLAAGIQIDIAEVEAITECARAFLIGQPQKDVRVHVGWCENDYQIDMAKPEGRIEYKRMIDQAAATGCKYVLFTPDHSGLSSLDQNADAWGWESLLFLNLGQKIRKGEWMPKRDPIPADVQEILDYAKGKNIKLLAYAYPSLPFMQNPEWTAWRTKIGQKPEGYLTVDTGLRSYQDWWVNLLVEFYEYTGIGGYSFDHWWMAYTDDAGLVSSKYQQWFGTRRILEELRRRKPEMIVDGRQQYHGFGTWTWLAGTYPHPLMTDEQPGSFNAIPDLSTDRVTAGRQRWTAWRLMTRDFTPVEVRPGFITHQTQRNDAEQVMRRDRFRTRDWDYLGWKFNLMSTIATAPFNKVVNYLPARDLEEFNAFGEADKLFLKQWMDFTDENAEYLRNIRPIIGQPMVGRCDGTSAIVDDRGYIFLFNPNYRRMSAVFSLDESIGINGAGRYLLTGIFPVEGLHPGKPGAGYYTKGDAVSIEMDGVTAMVLRIEPAGTSGADPVLFNCTGKAALEGETLAVKEAGARAGESVDALVCLPEGRKVSKVVVNGREQPFTADGQVIAVKLAFAGTDFRQAQQAGAYDPSFTGTVVERDFTVPARIFSQLAARRSAWPVTYTDDDRVAPWLDASRLLLYVQIAEPYLERPGTDKKGKTPIRAVELKLEIDGKPVALKEAYNGVYPYIERSNLGFYVDISSWEPDVAHRIKVTLPAGLKPGQFQGIFADHVENEYTRDLR